MIEEKIKTTMYHEFFKIALISLVYILYIVYLYYKAKNKNKSTDILELIIKPSEEQKKVIFSLGIINIILIILFILFSIDFNMDIDTYTKIRILTLKQSRPILIIASCFLLWYFINALQPTVFYQNSIQYQGNRIKWTDIYKVKRLSDTKLKIYYKDKTNAFISILHSSEQKKIIDQIVMSKKE